MWSGEKIVQIPSSHPALLLGGGAGPARKKFSGLQNVRSVMELNISPGKKCFNRRKACIARATRPPGSHFPRAPGQKTHTHSIEEWFVVLTDSYALEDRNRPETGWRDTFRLVWHYNNCNATRLLCGMNRIGWQFGARFCVGCRFFFFLLSGASLSS